jgi:tryptophan-rich sensory protein
MIGYDAQSLFVLAGFVVLTFVAAASGAVFVPGAWYASLAKPWWTPPGWVFAPIWMVLYILIAVAGWLIWYNGGVSTALLAWGIQLAFNAAWSYLMFGLRRIDLAAVDVVLMLVSISLTIFLSWDVSRTAAYLLMPYLAWVVIAATLNLTILAMNR